MTVMSVKRACACTHTHTHTLELSCPPESAHHFLNHRADYLVLTAAYPVQALSQIRLSIQATRDQFFFFESGK